MQPDGPTQVFNILKANPPWLFGSEIVAHSRHAARLARQPHSRPTRLLMALVGAPPVIGRGSVYTLLDVLETQGHVQSVRMDESNYLDLLRQRYGHGEMFATERQKVEQNWQAQLAANGSKADIAYRYAHWANNTGGPGHRTSDFVEHTERTPYLGAPYYPGA